MIRLIEKNEIDKMDSKTRIHLLRNINSLAEKRIKILEENLFQLREEIGILREENILLQERNNSKKERGYATR